MSNELKISLVFALVFLSGCRWNLNESNPIHSLESLNDFYIIESSNLILKDIVCETFLKNGIASDCSGEDHSAAKNVYHLQIDSVISETSIDFWRNTAYSLGTITLGAFVSTSADISFQVEMEKKDTVEEPFRKEYKSEGQNGIWAIMPPLTGLISTVGGSFLNYYRTPNRLEHYCLKEEPGKVRVIFEESREEFCDNYKVFLIDSYRKIETELLDDLLKNRTEEIP